jgi:RsiW-degrading membrane proteinase PrsW (M82 family)
MSLFDKNASLGQVLLSVMFVDALILAAGVFQYFQTNNPIWIVAAALISGALIIFPAIMHIKRQQERDNASR